MRRRGEYVERAFPHTYDTGGMRRTHLRGHIATLLVLMRAAQRRLAAIWAPHRLITAMRGQLTSPTTLLVNSSTMATCTTGC